MLKKLNLYAYVELKVDSGDITYSQAQIVYECIRRYDMTDHITIISFGLKSLLKMSKLNNSLRYGFIYSGDVTGIDKCIEVKNVYGYDYFADYSYSTLTQSIIEKAVENDIELEVWTVDSEDTIKNLDSYISGVTSNSIVAHEVFKKEYIS